MNIEIEAKMRLPEGEALEQALADAGAEHVADLVETNTYFDRGNELKASDQGLRIRVETRDDDPDHPLAVITHKGPRAHGQLKSRTETETPVGDPQAAAELLRSLGYNPVLTFEKHRRRFLLGDCRVEIDTLPYLGRFVEIEGHRDEDVLAVREQLGMADRPMIKASYIAMLLTHMSEQQITDDVVRLEDAAVTQA